MNYSRCGNANAAFAALLRAALLALAAGLAASCGGGHSMPSEPETRTDSLSVLSVSPPVGTAFAAGRPFEVHVTLRYHLAGGPGGSILFDELRADGSPLIQGPDGILLPIFNVPFPLIQADGTFPFDDKGQVPAGNVGPAVLLRFRMFPRGGGASTATVTLRYAIAN